MKHAFTEEDLDRAWAEVSDAGERLLGCQKNEAEALRLARRIAGWAPLLVQAIEEREVVSGLDPRMEGITYSSKRPPTED